MKSKILSSTTLHKKPYFNDLKSKIKKSKEENSFSLQESEEKIHDNKIIDRLRTISVKSKKKVEEKKEEEERRLNEVNNISISSEGKNPSGSEERDEERKIITESWPGIKVR